MMVLDITPSPMAQLVHVLHWLAGFIVMAEGLNKLHRTAPLQQGLAPRERVIALLKVLAWICLVLGAGGALIRPFVVTHFGGDLHFGRVLVTDRVSLADLMSLGGFALLIVRSRFKEPKP